MKKIISIALASALVLSSVAFAQGKKPMVKSTKPAVTKKATMKKATMKKGTMKKATMKKGTMKKAAPMKKKA